MADLGTVGTALSKSTPPPPPPPTTTAPDDSSAQPDVSGVGDVVRANRAGTKALMGRLQDIDTRSDALRPPVMQPTPPPPQEQATPIADRWGSVAMMLAGFGGLLTRQPLTTSLNAMAAVNHAYNDGDAAAAKTAFDTWKVANGNAIKMNEFTNKIYDDAIKKFSTDRAGAVAEIRANAAALKDDVVIQLLDSGQTDRAMQILTGRVTGTAQLSERTELLTLAHQNIAADTRANPSRPPQEQAKRNLLYLQNKDPDDTSKDYSKTAPTQLQVIGEDGKTQLIYADRDTHTGGWVTADENRTPIHADASGGFRIMPKTERAPTVSGMDAAEIKRLMDGGMSFEDARRKVQDKPVSAPQLASKEDATRAGIAFKQQTGHAYDEATASDADKSLYADLTDAAAKQRGAGRAQDKPLSAAAAENARLETLAQDQVTKATGRPYDPKNPDDKVAAAKAVEALKVQNVETAAAARLKATLAVHDAHDALDSDTVVAEAHYLRLTGKMSALGLGSSIARKQILDERGKELREEHSSIATDIARQSDIHALQQQLNNLARSRGNLEGFAATAMKEADLTLEKAKAGEGGGVPMINRWVQAGRRSIKGDPAVSSFDAALISFKNEYARIMSSPTATGGQTSDAARSEADTLINSQMSPEAIQETIATMKQGMVNRISSIREEYEATKGRIAQLGGEVDGGQGAFPNAPRIGTVEDGHRYKGGDPSQPSSWEATGG